ncbi:hypothetical protein JY97_00560 [Alkalispirochaeta odontotermitis]|nr:hypothetical protein JY97_00560 [Alkalispirochaeta odontotermitis]
MNMETRRKKALEMARRGVKRDEIRKRLSIDYQVLKLWLDIAGVKKLTNKRARKAYGRKAGEKAKLNKVHPIWGVSDAAAKRQYHTAKAANAARAQLKALGAL